jgi:hypothetical protein
MAGAITLLFVGYLAKAGAVGIHNVDLEQVMDGRRKCNLLSVW